MAILKYEDVELESKDGESMQEAAEQLGVPFGCKDGRCGTCIVEVQDGQENLSEKNEKEEDMGLEDKQRLACQCVIKSGTVTIDF